MDHRVRTILALRAAGMLVLALAAGSLVEDAAKLLIGVSRVNWSEATGATGRIGVVLAKYPPIGLVEWALGRPVTLLGLAAGLYLLVRGGHKLVRPVPGGART